MAKIIKFNTALENYAVNDVASFDDKIAAKIIEKGYGEEISLESTKIKKDKDDK